MKLPSIMGQLHTVMRRFLPENTGAAAVEGALVMPLVIFLMAGGIEFGRALAAYHMAEEAMRSATRYLARVPKDAICTGQWGFTNARNLAVYGKISPGTDPPSLPNWTTGTVSLQKPITCPPDVSLPVVVQLQSAVPYNVGMLSVIGFSNSLTFTVRHEERWIGE